MQSCVSGRSMFLLQEVLQHKAPKSAIFRLTNLLIFVTGGKHTGSPITREGLLHSLSKQHGELVQLVQDEWQRESCLIRCLIVLTKLLYASSNLKCKCTSIRIKACCTRVHSITWLTGKTVALSHAKQKLSPPVPSFLCTTFELLCHDKISCVRAIPRGKLVCRSLQCQKKAPTAPSWAVWLHQCRWRGRCRDR